MVRLQTAPEVRGDFLSIISLAESASKQRVDAERLSSPAIARFLLTLGSLPTAWAIGACFPPVRSIAVGEPGERSWHRQPYSLIFHLEESE